MSKLVFGYPFMLFAKCNCTNQIPIQAMEIHEQSENTALKYTLQCPVCGDHLHRVVNLNQEATDLTNSMNAFKVIPTLKDELAIIKLDTVKAKLQDDEIKLYGNYSHLRFWDNMVQKDIIKIHYKKED
ncbi:hypothetical protein HNQ80_001260 [Anaerosolibacter carboniphilus]|uniref:Uncharacterized protein n=1 Tax=Anaerosolibacter carboniphilus TaxID=1417629 RepID=A0A841KPD9_9FIRM|nr:hypothetical protein [Anaerosolibacter carboniphilus]MBB6215171.1 hypothetical protein [Anaerosolibacter carboniphilus]